MLLGSDYRSSEGGVVQDEELRGLSTDEILAAGQRALIALLKAGKDRVVHRDGQVQVLRPGDEGYWDGAIVQD